MKQIVGFFLLFTSAIHANVNSQTGQVKLDIQSNGLPELTLNQTGVGLGVLPSEKLHVTGNAILSNSLSVGNEYGSSNFNMNGSLEYSFQMVDSDTSLSDQSMVFVDSSSDNITLTLPYAGNVLGRHYKIKKTSPSNSVWIIGGGNLIDDTIPIELSESTQKASVSLLSDGKQWYILGEKNMSKTIAYENLMGWWKLDEITGTEVVDSSLQNNRGILVNMLGNEWQQNVGALKGTILFDHTDNEYVSMGDVLDTGAGEDFTVSAWFKSSGSTSGIQRIVQKGGTGAVRKFIVYIASNNSLQIQIRDDAGDTNTTISRSFTGTDFYTGEWFHVTANWDSSEGKVSFYLNGGGKTSTTKANLVNADLSNARDFTIGATETGAQAFNGLIDDVRFYDRILTDSEIQAMYQQSL